MNGAVRIPAVRAVVTYEGRYLLAQHHNYLPETIGKWGLPGGRIEAYDADLVAALRRELHEEFAMTAEIVGFVAMYTYRDRTHQIFLARPHSVDFVINANEILGTAWLTLDEVAEWHRSGRLHTGFEFPAIRASVTRYGKLLQNEISAR
ncbi:MAG TPA: NUDIX hydrolase [Aggregatilineales bacterium]|nr:NUDIX hydrolase [Aggregatilineales bacterium]